MSLDPNTLLRAAERLESEVRLTGNDNLDFALAKWLRDEAGWQQFPNSPAIAVARIILGEEP